MKLDYSLVVDVSTASIAQVAYNPSEEFRFMSTDVNSDISFAMQPVHLTAKADA